MSPYKDNSFQEEQKADGEAENVVSLDLQPRGIIERKLSGKLSEYEWPMIEVRGKSMF